MQLQNLKNDNLKGKMQLEGVYIYVCMCIYTHTHTLKVNRLYRGEKEQK